MRTSATLLGTPLLVLLTMGSAAAGVPSQWQWRDSGAADAAFRPFEARVVGDRVVAVGRSGYQDGLYVSVLDAASLLEVWRAPLSPIGAARVDAVVPFAGGMYVGGIRGADGMDSRFVARVDASGAIAWVVDGPSPTIGRVALTATADGVAFAEGARIAELAQADGRHLRATLVPGADVLIQRLAADPAGNLYATLEDSGVIRLAAVAAGGTAIRWQVVLTTASGAAAAEAGAVTTEASGDVLVQSIGSATQLSDRTITLARLDPVDGSARWRTTDAGDGSASAPIGDQDLGLCATGGVTAGWLNGRLLVVETATGSLRWAGGPPSGGVHVSCGDGRLLVTGSERLGPGMNWTGVVERRVAATGDVDWRTNVEANGVYRGTLLPDGSALVFDEVWTGLFASNAGLRRIATDGQSGPRIPSTRPAALRGVASLIGVDTVQAASFAVTNAGLSLRRAAVNATDGAPDWQVAESASEPELIVDPVIRLASAGGAMTVAASAYRAFTPGMSRNLSIVSQADAGDGAQRFRLALADDGSSPFYRQAATGPDGSVYVLRGDGFAERRAAVSGSPLWFGPMPVNNAALLATSLGLVRGRSDVSAATSTLHGGPGFAAAWTRAPPADVMIASGANAFLGAGVVFEGDGDNRSVVVALRDVASGAVLWSTSIPFQNTPVAPTHLLAAPDGTVYVAIQSAPFSPGRRVWLAKIAGSPPVIAWLQDIALGGDGVTLTSLLSAPDGRVLAGIRPDRPLVDDDTGSASCRACPEYLVAIDAATGAQRRWHHAGTFGSRLPPDQVQGVHWLGLVPDGAIARYEQHWDDSGPIGLRIGRGPLPTPTIGALATTATVRNALVARGVLSMDVELQVTNPGPAAIDGVTIESDLPPGYAISSVACAAVAGAPCAALAQRGQFRQRLALASGASATLRFVATRVALDGPPYPDLALLANLPFDVGSAEAPQRVTIPVPMPATDAVFAHSFESP